MKADDERQPTTTTGGAPPREAAEQAKLIGAAIAAFLLLLFFFQNMQQVDIKFLWMEWHTRMIWSLIGSAVLGGAGVFFGMWFSRRRQKER
jgi:uncharacterized integral membrane protein